MCLASTRQGSTGSHKQTVGHGSNDLPIIVILLPPPLYLLTCVLSPSTLVVADACGGGSMAIGNMLVSFLAGSTRLHGQARCGLSLLSKVILAF